MKKKVETAKQIRSKVIRAAITEHERAKRKLKTTRAVSIDLFKQAETVLRTADISGLEVRNYWLSTDYNDGLYLHINARADQGLKSGPVAAMVGFLDGMLGCSRSRDYVTESFAERSFKFGHDNHDGLIVSLEIDVSDAATCRKVKVGEKMEMVAQYEIQCSD